MQEFLLLSFLLLVGLPAIVLGLYQGCLTCAATWWRLRSASTQIPQAERASDRVSSMPRLVVLIPAHNEESVIERSLDGVLALDYPKHLFDVVVIADNCSAHDRTARIARRLGCHVWERKNLKRRGKGYALEEAIEGILNEQIPLFADVFPPDAFVILDADTLPDSQLLQVFASGLERGHEWMQGLYTGYSDHPSWRSELLNSALYLFNGTWTAGIYAVGLSAPLRGNGMCFASSGLRRRPWSAHGLAEDLEFSWTLRLAGERVHFMSAAKVFGELVSRDVVAASSQRERWERGRALLRKQFAGELLRSRTLSLSKRVMYFLDLYALPFVPSSVLIGVSTLLAGAFVAAGLDSATFLLILFMISLSGTILYALSPIWLFGLSLRVYGLALHFPRYACWKLMLRLKGSTPSEWIRTRRESETRGAG